MFCTNCGVSNKDIAEFCANCGESLGEPQTEGQFSHAKVRDELTFLKRIHFLKVFYDFSFSQLVSPKIMKFLYGLSILFAGLIALLLVTGGFKISIWFGFLSLFIGAPLIFLLIVISTRVLLETILVIFRIADQLSNAEMPDQGIIKREENLELKDVIQWNI
jgi:hypothetical protein